MSRQLRHEQKEAISTLVHGSDLLAVLPTGFAKSLIFQLLIRVQEILSSKPACAIVVCPLKSLGKDQLIEASSRGLSATSLASARKGDVENGKYQLIFASAEEILTKLFLSSLRKSSSPLHENLAAIIVDESNTSRFQVFVELLRYAPHPSDILSFSPQFSQSAVNPK